MEECKRKVDSLNSDISVAGLPLAFDTHIVKCKVFELVQRPWREHQPREDRVYEEDEGVGDSSSHAIPMISTVLRR